MFKQASCQVVSSPSPKCFMGTDIMLPILCCKVRICQRSPNRVPVPNARVGGTKLKAWIKLDMFEQFLYEAIASVLP